MLTLCGIDVIFALAVIYAFNTQIASKISQTKGQAVPEAAMGANEIANLGAVLHEMAKRSERLSHSTGIERAKIAHLDRPPAPGAD